MNSDMIKGIANCSRANNWKFNKLFSRTRNDCFSFIFPSFFFFFADTRLFNCEIILFLLCFQYKVRNIFFYSPLPLLPTNLRSLNLATWFFISAVEFRSSAQQFSSLPARTVTRVPSPTSPRATTLNATGRVLLDRQWVGNWLHKKYGEPVIKSNAPFYYTKLFYIKTEFILIKLSFVSIKWQL